MFFSCFPKRLLAMRLQLICLVILLGFVRSSVALPAGQAQSGDKATAASARVVLKNHVPAVVKQLQPLERLSASRRIHLSIGLPLHDPDGLQSLLQKIYDPGSPQYRQYLTPDQLTERFGPLAADYDAVIAWAKSQGLVPTSKHPNRLLLEVEGPVSAVEAAFHVKLHRYQHPTEQRTFFAPDVDPALDIAVPVITVSGLSDFFVPRPHSKIQPMPAGVATPRAGSGPSGTYAGNDFRAAYAPGLSLTGTGQSIALLEFDGYYTSDITSYESQFGLPSMTLSNVAVNGGVSNPGSGNSEVALDIEMVIAMAPGLSKVYVYEAPNSLANFEPMLSQMQTDNLAKQIGCSWGGGSENPTAENVFQLMAAQGQSFFNATGDSDAFVGAIPFPSDSPNITQVGATTLTTGTGASFSSETVWNWGRVQGSYTGSSGGISTVFALPVWQQGISMTANKGSTSFRNVPDVALTGDNIYVLYNNGSAGTFGGTSCAAPLWAAVTALANQRAASVGQSPVGFINPAIYTLGKGASYTSCFHDTTTGNNFSSSSKTKFAGVTGFDLCTGWGTPIVSNLINALVVDQSAATKLTIQTQPSSTATAGVPFDVQPVIRIEDATGHLVTNDNSTIVTAIRSAGAGTLQGVTAMTAVGGLVTFTNLLHQYATNITIAFTSGALTGATSSVVAIAPAAVSQLQILLPGQTATPTVSPGFTGTPTAHISGTSFNVTVKAVDAFWNLANNVSDTVTLSSSDTIATLPPNAALTSGTATFNVTLKTVGTQNVSVSDVSQPAIVSAVSAGVSITPATLTVVASNSSRSYGQTNPIFGGTLTGVESGDNITATFNSSATANSAKGNYAIVPSLNDPNNRLGNYTILSTNGTLTVTAVPLSVTASNASRQYGQTNPVFNGNLAGLQNNDNITAVFVSAATTNSAVGNYNITPALSDPTGRLSNYTVTTNNGTLTVMKVPVSVTANDASRGYGQTNPIFGGTLAGVASGDNITATFNSSATTNSAMGNYAIVPSLNDPNNRLGNYTVLSTNGTLTVTSVPLSVTANNASRQYGVTNPVFSGTLTGVQNNDNLTATFFSVATTNSTVGNYNITPTLSDPTGKLSNYTVTTNNGTLTVTTALVSVTANDASRGYGQTNPIFGGTLAGVEAGDNITATFNSSATTNSAKGSYAIVPTLNDPNNRLGNYTVLSMNGTLTVTSVPLNVTANNASRQYGLTNPLFSGTLDGLRNSDNITATFTSAATTNSAVGNYNITPTLSDPTGKLSNYTATTNNGTLTVTTALVSVTANDASRGYGQTNPIFGGTLTGVEAGDNITATFNSSATTNSAKGNYAIVPSLNDPNNRLGNYTVLSTNGTLTVTSSPLSVTASNASRIYGQTNPVFSGALSGLQNNDNIAATFVSAATTNSAVGNYNITPTLADPTGNLTNYTVTTNNGTLTVTTALVSVTANDASRTWGATNPVFTGTIVGLQNNDDVTANYSTIATTNSAVGAYAITFTLSDPSSKLSNYVVSTNNGTLTVLNNPPAVVPVADQVASVGATVSLTVSASDPDQASQTLSFNLDPGAPAGAAIDSSSGAFAWTVPAVAQGTTNLVTVRVSDNAVPSQSATTTFNIVVIDRPTLADMQSNPDGLVFLTWNVAPGATYAFQSKNALTDSTWTDLTQITPGGSTVTVSDNPGGSQRFYRLADGSAVSDPAGVMPLVFLGVSDSYVSIPFTRAITSSGAVASVVSNTVTVNGANWTAGQFVYSPGAQSNNYYARFDSGALEGRVYNVITNDTNTLTVDFGADTLDGAAPGDVVSVVPHWSLNSAFPNGKGILASPSQGNRFTEILLPDSAGTGINLSATKIYYFNSSIWKQVGQGSVNHGDDVLPLSSYFIVRQNVPTNSTMNSVGAVIVSTLALPLHAQTETEQDNSVGLIRASAVALDNSGLISSGAFEASPLPGTRTDELLTFDNTVAQKNKSSSAVYYYWNSGWRRVGSGSTDFGTAQVFTPGAGFIIRKATNATSVIWTNAP